MEIIHRISLSSSDIKALEKLDQLGIVYKKKGLTAHFDITESDELWSDIKTFIEKFEVFDGVGTKFSLSEKKNSSHLVMMPGWSTGYPEPSLNRGYITETYDISNYCEICGVGLVQKSPFLLKKEPKWGKR